MGDSAVLLLGYNRPEETSLLMDRLAQSCPSRLYVSVDGPRDSPHDRELVQQVQALMSAPPWRAKVKTRFLPSNVGSRQAIEGALNWFFSLEPEGIVLEDDCHPSRDFFTFAEDILNRYRNEPKIWGMTGSNTADFQFDTSYGFIRHPLTWGWATWADRWNRHNWTADIYLAWTKSREVRWPSPLHKHAFKRHLDSIARYGYPDAWDYQWAWTVMQNQGLWVVPRSQLIENVGFAENALNQHPSRFTGPGLSKLGALRIPHQIAFDPKAEKKILHTIYGVRAPRGLSAVFALAKSLKTRVIHSSLGASD